MIIDCASMALPLIEEATEKFSPLFHENAEYKDIFLDYCSAFDKIIERMDCTAYEININERDMTINVTLDIIYAEIISKGVCMELKDKLFMSLMERAVSMEFFTKGTGEDVVAAVKFTFPSIWEKAE